mmetsp:Transcript_25132/g.28929  ORF Transcript_25132/g.28929 Transcript_25132/m.28929 type:complete len:215 (-) Transcript_25132:1028-1672(-)
MAASLYRPSKIILESRCSSRDLSALTLYSSSSTSCVTSLHSTSFESEPPVRSVSPAQSIAQILSSCSSNVLMQVLFLTFQIFQVPSEPAENICSPLFTHRTFTVELRWPSKVFRHWPFETFHSLIVLSLEADARIRSKGENSTSQTPRLWPLSVNFNSSLLADQILIVLSWEAVATTFFLSPGDTRTTLMYFMCATSEACAEFTTIGNSFGFFR